MKLSKIIDKYEISYYMNILINQNNANFGLYHNIEHFLDVIVTTDNYISGEKLSPTEKKNLMLATIFHDFNFISNKTDDDNLKSCTEAFLRYSVEDKVNTALVLILLTNLKITDKIYGNIPLSYQRGIKLIRAINEIGYYINVTDYEIIQYAMRKSHELNMPLESFIEIEKNKILKYKSGIAEFDNDVAKNKDVIESAFILLQSFVKQNKISSQTLKNETLNAN